MNCVRIRVLLGCLEEGPRRRVVVVVLLTCHIVAAAGNDGEMMILMITPTPSYLVLYMCVSYFNSRFLGRLFLVDLINST